MGHTNRKPGKHLTLSDRFYIEQELLRGSSFKKIGGMLQKDPTTISKEIRRNASHKAGERAHRRSCHQCMLRPDCTLHGGDTAIHCLVSHRCGRRCKICWEHDASSSCEQFTPWKCDKPSHPPYVCNACRLYSNCPLPKNLYQARFAQRRYERTLKESRQGINMTPQDLQTLNGLISPLIMKGQPLSHIFAVHADEIPVCRRTLYNYLDQRVFQARNIDLPRRVRYKKRRKAAPPKNRNPKQIYRNKRTYKDFLYYLETHPDTDVVEMDTVKGSLMSGKCLLTLLFRSCSFMIIILMKRCTQGEVVEAIDTLMETLGPRLFRKYFPVILTDNGPEFKNPWDIEKASDGKHRTFVYYCDPYVSNQKARLEKNHEYIRYVIPKGRSMFRYTQEDINLLASHINSTSRDGLNGQTPYDLAQLLLDKRIPALTGIVRIAPDDVQLKPALLDHTDHSEEAADE
ncbi:MAG: IS30 family transposase [Firmicutes bacterium]|nr:IS30 family transposase [Bacillota bacterium]